ncbi:hypothetical protein PMAYCL1PPCAC_11864, partial [Pristionchus mayeri]
EKAEELRMKMEEEGRMHEEKEEEMKEGLRKKEKEVEDVAEEVKRGEKEMVEMKNEMNEMGRRVEEKEKRMKGMEEEKRQMEVEKERNEKEIHHLTEKVRELQQSLDGARSEGGRILDLEGKIRELEQKNTVAEAAAKDATKHYQDLKSIREEEMAETLEWKTKVHDQKSIIESLKRTNEELEEKRKESVKTTEELRMKREEEGRRISEMDELRRDLERRREKQRRIEDELEIARKMTEEANRDVRRLKDEMKKEKEENEKAKENEERRMEWMNKELRDSEELKEKIEKEKEESEQRVKEALTEVSRYHDLYRDLNTQYVDFQNEARHQYATDLAEKEEELYAMRERLAELENYPGRVVSVDGRYTDSRSIFDLLPAQIKDALIESTDGDVRRGVESCKRMMIRGEIETPSNLHLLVESLQSIEMKTLIYQEHVDFLAGIFKKMDEQEGTEAQMSSIAGEVEEELIRLEREWKKMEKKMMENSERLRRSEEERRRMEEEVIRADDGRKKTQNDMKELRANLVRIATEKEEMTKAAREFGELHDKRSQELKDADEELEELKEQYFQLEEEKEEEMRKMNEELNELDEKLKVEMKKNSDLSRKLADETSTVRNLREELSAKKKGIDRLRSAKEKLKKLLYEMMEGMDEHFKVYTKVKARGERRQALINHTLHEIEKTRRLIGDNRIGKNLEELEETIHHSIDKFLAEEVAEGKEGEKIRDHFAALTLDKENW